MTRRWSPASQALLPAAVRQVYHDVTKRDQGCGGLRCLRLDRLRRRADDNAKALKTRLMEYYKENPHPDRLLYAKGSTKAVDGLADIDVVAGEVAAVLDRIPGQG